MHKKRGADGAPFCLKKKKKEKKKLKK